MKKINYLIVFMLICSSSAFAYDDLITGANPYTLSKGVGVVVSDASLVYLTAGDRIDADGEKQSLGDDETNFRIPIFIKYRIIENLESFVLLPMVSKSMGGETESGIGDIWLGAKYAIMPEGLLTVRGALNLATGDDDNGLGNTGGFGIDIGAIGDKWLIEEKLLARAQLGVRWQGEDGDTKMQPGTGLYLTGGLGYMVTENTWIHSGLELLTNGDNKFDGNKVDDSGMTNLDLEIGADRRFGPIGLGCSLIYTVTGKNSLADIGLRISGGYKF